MTHLTPEMLIDFIASSPSTFHISENLAAMLENAGFIPLFEGEPWHLVPGQSYYFRRNLTALVAFRLPENTPKGFQMASAHLDSPTFRLKGRPELCSTGYTRLNVEKYGGMLMPQWFDRPLSVAGRVLVEEGDALESRLVNVDRDLLVIPHLAIHQRPETNTGEKLSVQTDLLPLFGDETAKGQFLDTVARTIGKKGRDLLAFDLFLYLRSRGTIWGCNSEYFSAPRLDDLECAYTLIQALIHSTNNSEAVSLCTIFDNEEVGSGTKEGACSPLLETTLQRIADSLSMDVQQYHAALASSFMVSADNAHAQHPNHPEKSDPVNYPLMNQGIVIKSHGGQKYATDATSSALFQKICTMAQVPVQLFSNHSDQPGGSTLGNLSTAHVPVNTVDIGLAQLSMHSPFETAGVHDLDYLFRAMQTCFSTRICQMAPGKYRLL